MSKPPWIEVDHDGLKTTHDLGLSEVRGFALGALTSFVVMGIMLGGAAEGLPIGVPGAAVAATITAMLVAGFAMQASAQGLRIAGDRLLLIRPRFGWLQEIELDLARVGLRRQFFDDADGVRAVIDLFVEGGVTYRFWLPGGTAVNAAQLQAELDWLADQIEEASQRARRLPRETREPSEADLQAMRDLRERAD